MTSLWVQNTTSRDGFVSPLQVKNSLKCCSLVECSIKTHQYFITIAHFQLFLQSYFRLLYLASRGKASKPPLRLCSYTRCGLPSQTSFLSPTANSWPRPCILPTACSYQHVPLQCQSVCPCAHHIPMQISVCLTSATCFPSC